jgi:hypothetical protein
VPLSPLTKVWLALRVTLPLASTVSVTARQSFCDGMPVALATAYEPSCCPPRETVTFADEAAKLGVPL